MTKRDSIKGLGLIVAFMLAVLAAPAMAQPAPKSVSIDAIEGVDLTQGAMTAPALAAILTDIILTDGQFSVIEGGSGATRFVIRGSVIRYDPAAGGAGVQVGGMSAFGRAAGGGAKTRTTAVSIALRLVDPVTGKVVAAAKANGSASDQEADAGLIGSRDAPTLGASAFRRTATAKAFEDALRKAVNELASKTAAL